MTVFTLCDLYEVQRRIQRATDEGFVLAGGCVRDVLHNRGPKDFDAVLCLGTDDHAYAFEVVSNVSRSLSMAGWSSQCYMAYGINTGDPVQPGAFEEVFLACMKTKDPLGYDVDLLFSSKYTIEEHCQLHDCNVNVVWLDPFTTKGYGGNTLPASELVFRPGISQDRVDYMVNKLKAYGY